MVVDAGLPMEVCCGPPPIPKIMCEAISSSCGVVLVSPLVDEVEIVSAVVWFALKIVKL